MILGFLIWNLGTQEKMQEDQKRMRLERVWKTKRS
jgi:hypothetical protein